MNQVVYHGSPDSDINIITSHVSTHKVDCIYASDDMVVALLYICSGMGDLDTRLSSIDGNIELVERREGILKKLYDRDGYIYVLDGSTFEHYDYLWSKEVISFEKKLKPIRKIYFKNVLDTLFEEEKKENIKIYKYPSRPDNMPLDNSDLIDKYIGFERKGLTGAVDDLLKIYPEFNERVKIKMRRLD